jgi:small subunit ribosomal protein S18
MAKTSAKRGPKGKETTRRVKKKVSILDQEAVEYVDWKDANLLRRFMSDRAKIRARRVTGNDAQQQREVARAIKNAREMALLPYTNRVTTQRGRRADRDGDERRAPREQAPGREPAGEPGSAGAEAAEFEPVEAPTEVEEVES